MSGSVKRGRGKKEKKKRKGREGGGVIRMMDCRIE